MNYDAGKLQGLLGPQQMTFYDAGMVTRLLGSHRATDQGFHAHQMLEAGPAVYREGQPLTF